MKRRTRAVNGQSRGELVSRSVDWHTVTLEARHRVTGEVRPVQRATVIQALEAIDAMGSDWAPYTGATVRMPAALSPKKEADTK